MTEYRGSYDRDGNGQKWSIWLQMNEKRHFLPQDVTHDNSNMTRVVNVVVIALYCVYYAFIYYIYPSFP